MSHHIFLRLLCIALSFTSVAEAFVPKKSKQSKQALNVLPEPLVLRPTLSPTRTILGKQYTMQTDRMTNVPRLITGRLGLSIDITGKDRQQNLAVAERRATEWIIKNKAIFSCEQADELRLDHRAVLFDRADQFLKFRIYRSGKIVEDAVIDLRFKLGELVQVYNQGFFEAPTLQYSRRMDTKAVLTNYSDVNFQKSLYRVSRKGKSYRVEEVDRYQVDHYGEAYVVDVSTASGRIISAKALRHYISGQVRAELYPRYYKDALAEVPLAGAKIRGSGARSTVSDESGVFQAAEDLAPYIEGLESAVVKVDTRSGSLVKRSATRVDGRHDIFMNHRAADEGHADKDLAQNMIFYHTQLMVEYAKKFISAPWFGETLNANANLSSTCNAHWDGSTINFYSADDECANTGAISDVVYHEWGHGLDDNTGGIEDGAFSEGFGDIMSLLMTRSHILGIGFLLDGGFVRDLEPDLTYPKDRGEVHHEGLIIGGTFWDLYQLLKAKHGDDQAIALLSQYAFKGIVAASRYTELYDALLVIDDNDADPSNGTPNLCLINEAFTLHGLSTTNPRCLLGEIQTVEAVEIVGNGNGIIEPGEQIDLRPSLYNNTGESIEGLRASATLVQADAGISLDDSQLSWPTIENLSRVPSEQALRLSVGSDVACGAKAKIELFAQSTTREAKMRLPIQIGRLDAVEATYKACDLPVSIPDEDEAEVAFDVTGGQWAPESKVLNAHLTVKIKHTYVGDLRVYVVAPDGSYILVADGDGPDDDLVIDRSITEEVAGKLGAGTWKVVVRDVSPQDTGKVTEASLRITPANYRCDQ
jgi:hypothetical protein